MPTLSDILNIAAPVGGSIANGIIGTNAAGNAANTLAQGGQQAIQTVQQGQQQALGALGQTVQQQQQLFQPYASAGQQAAGTLATGVQPGGALVQPFSWTPAELQNDPAYQFRLQEGLKAIQAQENASGIGASPATAKALADYAAGTASQYENQDYQRQFGTYQYNQQTQLQALENQQQAGLNATAGESGALSNYGTNVANVDTKTASAIADLQTQIANARAAGQTAQASQLQGMLGNILRGVQGGQVLNSLLNPPTTPTVTPTTTQSIAPYAESAGGAAGAGAAAAAGSGATLSQFSGGADYAQGLAHGLGPAPYMNMPVGSELPGMTPATTVNIPELGYASAFEPGAEAGATAADLGATGAEAAGDVVTDLPGSIGTIAGLGDTGVGAAVGGAEAAGEAGGEAAATAAEAGGEAAGSTGLLGSVAGLLTNPWTIGIGGAILAAGALIKAFQVHPVADQWVHNVQNPFDKQAGTAMQSFVSNVKSGQMTQDQAVAAYNGMASVMGQYQTALQKFGTQGDKQRTVANQAQQTFNQWYGQNGSAQLGYMKNLISQQYGADAASSLSGSLGG